MRALEKELRGRDIAVESRVTSGTDAAYEIMRAAERVGADLVVISTHGRGGLGRWVFGSVAEKVLRYGDRPLLLVHARAS